MSSFNVANTCDINTIPNIMKQKQLIRMNNCMNFSGKHINDKIYINKYYTYLLIFHKKLNIHNPYNCKNIYLNHCLCFLE